MICGTVLHRNESRRLSQTVYRRTRILMTRKKTNVFLFWTIAPHYCIYGIDAITTMLFCCLSNTFFSLFIYCCFQQICFFLFTLHFTIDDFAHFFFSLFSNLLRLFNCILLICVYEQLHTKRLVFAIVRNCVELEICEEFQSATYLANVYSKWIYYKV